MSWLDHVYYDQNRDVEHDQHHFVPKAQTNDTSRIEYGPENQPPPEIEHF
jgi:hypothetical protein